MMKKYFKVNVNKYDINRDFWIYRPASINYPKDNSVMFINRKHIDSASVFESVSDCLIFWPDTYDVPESVTSKNVVIKCSNPHNDYARFFNDNNLTYLPNYQQTDVINGAYIAKSAVVGEETIIMPGAYIGGECVIGDKCYIGCGTKLIGEIHIGRNVVIRENTVLGADGLTTDRDYDGKAMTLPQYGSIVIEDDVQIGANVVIARGAIDETRVGRGSKIDSCSFISHNCIIGEDSFIVGETIMFGSSTVGNSCLISGNSTLMNTVTIGDGAIVGAGAVVTKSVPAKSIVLGNPAKQRDEIK